MNRGYWQFVLVLLFFSADMAFAQHKTKIACVGNSITFGSGIQNREENSYPAQLQKMLGSEYVVENFGVSGATLLSGGDKPYIKTNEYSESKNFQPDIVLIKLGTNDSKPQNRIYSNQYTQDYLSLINSYKSLESNPRIILLTPVRCFLSGDNSISERVMQELFAPQISEIAYKEEVEIIDLHSLYGDVLDLSIMPDKLHPSDKGAMMMAQKLSRYLTAARSANKESVVERLPVVVDKNFNFHGYKGHVFNMGDVECYVVEPKVAANGAPWLIRARFWGHEPQTDIALLELGYHITYCDVADLYGSQQAIERWNKFYDLLTSLGKLNKKVVLEGMSRGGLIVYNWAAQNSKKVACIYADAPVMDIKSWPMGSKGSPSDVVKMMAAYGFKNEAEAKEWSKNPVDHADKVKKIPMLHVVGDIDTVVPVEDNTLLFARRLRDKGVILPIISKPSVGHHPHSLNNPKNIVDFILRAAY